MHKPIIPITLAYLSGIVLGYGFLYLPYTTGALVILLIATAGIFTLLKKLTFPRVLLVLRVADHGRFYLFTGDIGTDADTSLVMSGQDIKCDVVKVPHHGSRFSSSESFVSLARPDLAVACVGRENPYRHPADEVIERYEGRNPFLPDGP